MKPFFKELFAYNHRSNQQVIAALTRQVENIPEKCIQLQSHILNAHQVWNSRIEPNQKPFGIWDIHPIEDWAGIEQDNHENSLLILDKYNLEDRIHYKTSKGDPFSNTVRDILFQVINHSTYHRGQMAMDMRQNGLEPLVSDFIVYKR